MQTVLIAVAILVVWTLLATVLAFVLGAVIQRSEQRAEAERARRDEAAFRPPSVDGPDIGNAPIEAEEWRRQQSGSADATDRSATGTSRRD